MLIPISIFKERLEILVISSDPRNFGLSITYEKYNNPLDDRYAGFEIVLSGRLYSHAHIDIVEKCTGYIYIHDGNVDLDQVLCHISSSTSLGIKNYTLDVMKMAKHFLLEEPLKTVWRYEFNTN